MTVAGKQALRNAEHKAAGLLVLFSVCLVACTWWLTKSGHASNASPLLFTALLAVPALGMSVAYLWLKDVDDQLRRAKQRHLLRNYFLLTIPIAAVCMILYGMGSETFDLSINWFAVIGAYLLAAGLAASLGHIITRGLGNIPMFGGEGIIVRRLSKLPAPKRFETRGMRALRRIQIGTAIVCLISGAAYIFFGHNFYVAALLVVTFCGSLLMALPLRSARVHK